MDLNQAISQLQNPRDRPEADVPAPRIVGQMDFSQSKLALMRRAQLQRIAKGWGIPVKRDGTKDEILPALIAAEAAGIFKRAPKRPFHAWLAQFRPEDPIPPYDPRSFPDEPDLKDFQNAAPVVDTDPDAPIARPLPQGSPLTLDEIDARIEKHVNAVAERRGLIIAERMRVADGRSLIGELAKSGALDMGKLMDRQGKPVKPDRRLKANRVVDQEFVRIKARARELGVRTFAKSRATIEAEIMRAELSAQGHDSKPDDSPAT